MTLERVVIRGIGESSDEYRTKHGYTPEQAAEIRKIALMLYEAAWKEAHYDMAKVNGKSSLDGKVSMPRVEFSKVNIASALSSLTSRFRKSA